ncbi:MAG: heparan-alpha-glucosaminide N-acetyltransferase [Halobacteriota archaeon]|nr:heparan-alpha-glucosaminide N-acetyltransferase [Halobacteriota archaeon]
MGEESSDRFWELDLLRGVAVIMMVIFHFLYDLSYFGDCNLNVHYGFWWYFARVTATIFILLVGISLSLSYSRIEELGMSRRGRITKYAKRGLKVFLWGLVVTVVTWIFLRDGFIIFGVLHFIGISIILSYPFIKHRYSNLVLGTVMIAIGLSLRDLTFDSYFLIWLGFRPEYFYTFDYFPILPWFGVVLIGLFIGNSLYDGQKRKFDLFDLTENTLVRPLSFLGRHSLFIYLIHQPVLVATLYLLGVVSSNFFVIS